jgi:hypothetical protein
MILPGDIGAVFTDYSAGRSDSLPYPCAAHFVCHPSIDTRPKFPARKVCRAARHWSVTSGLLTVGKTDFEAIGSKPGDAFFQQARGIASVPSAATLR